MFLRKRGLRVKIHDTDRNTLCNLRNARIAGCTVKLLTPLAFYNGRSDGVFSSAASDEENFHFGITSF